MAIAGAGGVGGDAADSVRRIDSLLPDFTRHSWVNGEARQRWMPRLEAIRRAWSEIEWLSVVAGMRQCALVALTPAALAEVKPRWMAHRLSAAGLPGGADGGQGGLVYAFVGERPAVRRAEAAWMERDTDAIGELLGYPECCRRFFRETWVEHQWRDTTWPMAVRSAAADGQRVEVEAGDPPLANILWRWLGVRAVPHLPCRFDCEDTIDLGRRLLAVGARERHGDAVAWMKEILSWPVEWSALHGIAEIKTPILKIATRTDATAGKYTVRWKGSAYPAEGAIGLRFPYRAARPATVMAAGLLLRPGKEAPERPRAAILEATLGALPRRALDGRRIARFRLTGYFNLVELDDGSVGAAMNYDHGPASKLEERRAALEHARSLDPLLLTATAGPHDLLSLSLRVAIVSALSAPLLRAPAEHPFAVSSAAPASLFAGANRALVIGFGGYMDALARNPAIRALHVADLQYAARRAEMEAAIARYRRERPDLEMTISDGADTLARMRGADLVCISGSTLCNGSLDGLLRGAARGARIVLQGQSAGIYPLELFRRGVTVVCTTLKPPDLIETADANRLQSVLEGGLPPVYLTPAARTVAEPTLKV